jgi:hypothetical protein
MLSGFLNETRHRWIGVDWLIAVYAAGVYQGETAAEPCHPVAHPGDCGDVAHGHWGRADVCPFKPKQSDLQTRRQELQARTIQAEIVKLAIGHGGRLTAVEVMAGLGITAELATEHLNLLAHQTLAELEITESGTLVYAFQDVQALPEKLTAKRIADA